VNEEAQIEVIYQSPTNKDKIYLKQDLNWPKRRYKTGLGNRETIWLIRAEP
jgi:hypothetical protein